MLTTVIIILREVLEAAILISLLMVLHSKLHFYRYWLIIAIAAGIGCAWVYAQQFYVISTWFDGSGQEVINGLSLLGIGFCLGMQLLIYTWCYRNDIDTTERKLPCSLILVLTLSAVFIMVMAISREGSEIIIYYSGVGSHQQNSTSIIIGGIIGSGLGLCTGILSFVILYQLAAHNLIRVMSLLITLITAGMIMEAVQYFIQAGWLITDEPLWNSSNWLSESSIAGQLLYAVFAYEASPTSEEALAWLSTVIALCSMLFLILKNPRSLTKN